ncbi:hypothetical protein RCL1_007547 [Eukaryota sp. TZLM3-RCL]
MELQDCAFPLLRSLTIATSGATAFPNADYVFLCGARPRGPGMERGDLLKINAAIFQEQGQAIEAHAPEHVKVVVVGNPANTNCLIAMSHAPKVPAENFTALTRLDHNRAVGRLAQVFGCGNSDVKNVAIFGNHSAKLAVSLGSATVNEAAVNDKLAEKFGDATSSFVTELAKFTRTRGAEVIKAKGSSSAMSAAKASVDHLRDLVLGSEEYVSMAVLSDGETYGIPAGIIASVPCKVANGKYEVVTGYKLSEFEQQCLQESIEELVGEREVASDFLGPRDLTGYKCPIAL